MSSLRFCVSLLFTLFLLSSSTDSVHDDRNSLLEFKFLIANDPQHSLANWSPSNPLWNWTGITCNRRHQMDRVIALNLTAMDLQGRISPSLGNLSFLRSIDLSNNALHGNIPPPLGRLFRLRELWLYSNQLEGSIPGNLSSCHNLVELDLSFNNLKGNIPLELGSLSHLRRLILEANSLTGTIPSSFGNLSALIILNIGNNTLSGVIPPQFGLFKRLQTLYLFQNELSGNIPTSLSNISTLIDLGIYTTNITRSIPQKLGLLNSLQRLDLSRNDLSGNIPVSLSNISSLVELNISMNQLTGNIPASLSNISSLVELDISMNKLTGSIPAELGLLTNLGLLHLFKNNLSGKIPTSLSNISSVFDLDISYNKITGSIPRELGLLINLQKLRLVVNELSGTIPTSLSNISSLNNFQIAINNLVGQIPWEFGKLNNLSILNLYTNQLSGNIPNSIGNCSKLTILDLGSNYYLQGIVPIELGKLSLLERLNLGGNQFESGGVTNMPFITALTNCSHLEKLFLGNSKLNGILPFTIGKLSPKLSILDLAENRIEGNIPVQISNLSSLTYLSLKNNIFNGSIPSLQSFVKLEILSFANNQLEGNIPNDFKPLKYLGLLHLSGNMLSGRIPNSLQYLKQLRGIDLSHNSLSGKIPITLGECSNLLSLDLSHNRLSGSIPQEISGLSNLQLYLNLSWNLLEGSLPIGISKIVMAQAIDISANQLTGHIPVMLGDCIALQSLNLSRNAFQGSIPESLGKLQNLMLLDLSSNSLSGSIPVALEKMKMLQYLNLSFNKLMGEVSKGGFSANQTIFLIGNPGLCGPEVFLLHACPTSNSHFKVRKRVLLPIVGAGFILFCLVLSFLWRKNLQIQNFLSFLWRNNLQIQNFDFPQAILQKIEHQRISYQELFSATSGFIEANLLGKGTFGSVYKGILSDDTLLAVKVLNLQDDQVEKSFEVECKVLQKVRHRNLVRIITSCSNLHFKALVFEFMCNGSLENHLYLDRDDNNGEKVCELGLDTRLDIVIDVAHAMEYLHHDSPVQVVHCDIKPSNVLLDEDMVGHVTDFGIARLIGVTSSDSLSSTLSLKGSMGYIAPEYGLGEEISIKGDVYSYGIMLLEMFTRMRPTSDMFFEDLNLHKWVNSAFPNRLKDVIDNNLLSEVDGNAFEENAVYKCLFSLLHLGLFCSKDSPAERPTMRDVVMALKRSKEDLVENMVVFKRPRQSISNMLRNTRAGMNVASASNDKSFSTF